MTIASHFNTTHATGIRDTTLTINHTTPVMATPAMIGIIAVAAVTCTAGLTLGFAAR